MGGRKERGHKQTGYHNNNKKSACFSFLLLTLMSVRSLIKETLPSSAPPLPPPPLELRDALMIKCDWAAGGCVTFVSGEVSTETDEHTEDGKHDHGNHSSDESVVNFLWRPLAGPGV